MTPWIKIIQLALGIITILITLAKLGIVGDNNSQTSSTQGMDGNTPAQSNDPIEKGKDAVSGGIDWLSGDQKINDTKIPNWLALTVFITIIFAIFRK